MKTISPEQLKARLAQGDVLPIIDVREAEEVAAGMIPGASHIPLGEIPARLADIPKDRETILVCRSGNRSSRALAYLEQQGYGNLVNLDGGMLEWEKL